MSHSSFKRVTLILFLLELSCLSYFVEAAARNRHAHFHRQSWNRPSQNWWSWFQAPVSNPQPRSPQTFTPAPNVPPTLQSTSSVQPIQQAPPPPLASPVQPQQTPSPLAAPAQSLQQQSSLPLALPVQSLSQPPSLATSSSAPLATQSPLAAVSAPLSTSQTRDTLVPTTPIMTPADPAPALAATQLPAPSSSQASKLATSAAAQAASTLTPTVQPSSLPPSATPLPVNNQTQGGGCSNLRVRSEWRTLTRQQQASYITAVKCLAKLPSKLLPGGDYRRYDDFQNVHSRMRTKIHWMSLFLPWHRQFMFLYEQALRNECGYTGNLPRWDWTLDSNDMTKAPIWSADPVVGFGSDGRNFTDVNPALDGGAVADGAFANWDLYYPEYHQLQRNYNLPSQYKVAGRSWGSQYFDQAAVSRIQSQTTYAKFAVALEGTDPASTGPSNPGPHSIIHVVIGGEISPTSYAANEPLFYLHHTNVDYLWWRWQNTQRSNRLNAYGGPTTRGSTKDTAKLTDSLKFLGMGADVQVKDTMDTYSAKYCYTY